VEGVSQRGWEHGPFRTVCTGWDFKDNEFPIELATKFSASKKVDFLSALVQGMMPKQLFFTDALASIWAERSFANTLCG
jgi:hypothetical protein